MEKEFSEVNIKKAGSVYIITVKDNMTDIENNLAITKSELEKIVFYGKIILRESDKN